MCALSLSAQIENIHSTPTTLCVPIRAMDVLPKFSLSLSLSRIVGAHCETFFLFYQMGLRFTNSFAIVHTLFYYFHFECCGLSKRIELQLL